MEARIIQKNAMLLVGLATNVTLKEVQENQPTYALAQTFRERRAEIPMCRNPQVVFGVSTDPEDYQPDTDIFEYFIGVEVSSLEPVPAGMVARALPANTYVMFTFTGTAEQAGAIHHYFYATWLMQHPYELCGRYNIEIYDERHHGPESAASVTELCFPIQSKRSNEPL